MSDSDLTSPELRAQHADAIRETNTFKPQGVSKAQALDFFDAPEGMRYLEHLKTSAPNLSQERLIDLAIQQVRSGTTLPQMQTIEEPLIKLVAHGQPLSEYSPFLARESEVARTLNGEGSIADRFGLPIASEAQAYDIYAIHPKGQADVFVSEIAPTEELGGRCVEAARAFRRSSPTVDSSTPANSSARSRTVSHQARRISVF